MYTFGNLTIQIAPGNVVFPIILSGFGATTVFVPIATFSMATVSRENTSEGTGLTNLLRNLGGSVGISAITALVSRGAQTHQALMVGKMGQYNPVFSAQLAKIQGALTAQVGAAAAHDRSYGLMYQTLQQQASLWSYVDLFRLLVIVCLLCVPLVFLFKKPKGGAVAGDHVGAH
jgi:DHA2 family multidrug resistance protein